MELVCIYCYPPNKRQYADRMLYSTIYEPDELRAFGIKSDAVDFNELYIGKSEFYKLYHLWQDPDYLAEFYECHESYFRDSYWSGVNEEDFVTDVITSVPHIFRELREAVDNDRLEELFEPLGRDDEARRDYQRIRVKSKYGTIAGRFAFRIYAVKIDDGCYVITGGAVKIVKDMKDAPNTKIELKKLDALYGTLYDINEKSAFVEFIFG